MSQTPCKQCGFPLPIRWPRAGGNLAQPNNIHRCADRASIRSKHPPKVSYTLHLAYLQTHSSNPVSVTSIIKLGARIESS